MSNNDLLIRQKCEEMIAYGYVALRQFPKFERHVLAADRIRASIASWLAHASHAQSFGLQKSILHKAVFILIERKTKCTVLLPKIEDIINVKASIK